MSVAYAAGTLSIPTATDVGTFTSALRVTKRCTPCTRKMGEGPDPRSAVIDKTAPSPTESQPEIEWGVVDLQDPFPVEEAQYAVSPKKESPVGEYDVVPFPVIERGWSSRDAALSRCNELALERGLTQWRGRYLPVRLREEIK